MTKHVHNLKFLRLVRKSLRKTSTPQEKILWSRLRGKNFEYVFKRQQSIGKFVADFYCPKKNLIIEIDGSDDDDGDGNGGLIFFLVLETLTLNESSFPSKTETLLFNCSISLYKK